MPLPEQTADVVAVRMGKNDMRDVFRRNARMPQGRIQFRPCPDKTRIHQSDDAVAAQQQHVQEIADVSFGIGAGDCCALGFRARLENGGFQILFHKGKHLYLRGTQRKFVIWGLFARGRDRGKSQHGNSQK